MEAKRLFEFFKEPVVLKNVIKDWQILQWDEGKWCHAFSDKTLSFRSGARTFQSIPRWERTCQTVDMKLDSFFKGSKNPTDSWFYFDYKDLESIFGKENAVTNAINWNSLGFEIPSKESTLWIGSKGAHTPCHYDTYGFNLVAQLYGRKMWILIPPGSSGMQPTRVPYEESSVYNDFDFYTPLLPAMNVENVYKVIVEPGQGLCVPHQWWHYVENLENSISVNTWIPVEEDKKARACEALAQQLILNLCKTLTEEEAKLILNPNELDLLETPPDFRVFEHVVETYLESNLPTREDFVPELPEHWEVEKVKCLKKEDWMDHIDQRAKEFDYNVSIESEDKSLTENVRRMKKLIDTFSHPVCLNSALKSYLALNNKRAAS